MRVFLSVILITLVMTDPAKACDLNKPFFGSGIKQIIEKYNLDVSNIKQKGEFVIPERGQKICKDLPKKSLVEFMFIDNILVQVKIDNINTNAELLDYAKELFGENDDKDRKKNTDNKSSIALWNSDLSFSVIYSAYTRGRDDVEALEITSKKYKWLFDKVFMKNFSD